MSSQCLISKRASCEQRKGIGIFGPSMSDAQASLTQCRPQPSSSFQSVADDGDCVFSLNASDTAEGSMVLEVEDGSGLWEVGAYYEEKPDEVALALLAAAHGARPFAVSKLDETDWVAQVRRELSPVEAGRFVVHGGHDAADIPINKVGLEIEAAMAFGTGHHGTTRGCLRSSFRRCYRFCLRSRFGRSTRCGGAAASATA